MWHIVVFQEKHLEIIPGNSKFHPHVLRVSGHEPHHCISMYGIGWSQGEKDMLAEKLWPDS